MLIILAAVVSAAAFFGCSRSKPNAGTLPVPGTWGTDSGDILSLRKDGAFGLTNLLSNGVIAGYSGTYTLVDYNHLKLTTVSSKGRYSNVYEFSETNGALTFHDPSSGKAKIYHLSTD